MPRDSSTAAVPHANRLCSSNLRPSTSSLFHRRVQFTWIFPHRSTSRPSPHRLPTTPARQITPLPCNTSLLPASLGTTTPARARLSDRVSPLRCSLRGFVKMQSQEETTVGSERGGKHCFSAGGDPGAHDASDPIQLPRSQVWVEKSRVFEGARARYVEIFRRMAKEAPPGRTDWPERLEAVATEAETTQKASSLIEKDTETWKDLCGQAVDAIKNEHDRLAELSTRLDRPSDQRAWARGIQRRAKARVEGAEGDWLLRERLIADLAGFS